MSHDKILKLDHSSVGGIAGERQRQATPRTRCGKKARERPKSSPSFDTQFLFPALLGTGVASGMGRSFRFSFLSYWSLATDGPREMALNIS